MHKTKGNNNEEPEGPQRGPCALCLRPRARARERAGGAARSPARMSSFGALRAPFKAFKGPYKSIYEAFIRPS